MPNLLQESNSFNHSDRTKGLFSQTTNNACRGDTRSKSPKDSSISIYDSTLAGDWILLKADVHLAMSSLSRLAFIFCSSSNWACLLLPLLRLVTISCRFSSHSANLSTRCNLKRMDGPSEGSLKLPDLPTSLSAPSSSSQMFATGAWPEHSTVARPECRF